MHKANTILRSKWLKSIPTSKYLSTHSSIKLQIFKQFNGLLNCQKGKYFYLKKKQIRKYKRTLNICTYSDLLKFVFEVLNKKKQQRSHAFQNRDVS